MNNILLSPIVLFVYNRPLHTKQTLEALQKNELAKESELFIYSDEAKNEDARKSVDEVREYIHKIDGFKKVTIIKREKNWGLADSIIDGVTKIVNEYGKIIVLEDDLVTSPYFLKFMNNSLDFYKDEEKVWHVSGYSQPFDKDNLKEHFFIKPTTCWGWATWSNRWKYFRKDTDYFLRQFDKSKVYDFNIKNSYPYHSHIVMNSEKKINTWAIFWYATVYFNQGLSLHPLKSFVENIGHDGSGMHCGDSCGFQVEIEKDYIEDMFPKIIAVKESVNYELARYYKGLKKSIVTRIINKLKKMITGNNK